MGQYQLCINRSALSTDKNGDQAAYWLSTRLVLRSPLELACHSIEGSAENEKAPTNEDHKGKDHLLDKVIIANTPDTLDRQLAPWPGALV